MPLISEASPSAFFKFVEQSLSEKEPKIMSMFEEVDTLMSPTSYHTGLLWALEKLAWFPDFLTRVTIILGHLAKLDPGGHLANRPLNSLRHIFLPCAPQTNANLEYRFNALTAAA